MMIRVLTAALKSSLTLIIAMAALLVMHGAHAQGPRLFYDGGPSLAQADLERANQATFKLLDPHPAPVGTSEAWAEPTTGNSGTVTMKRSYQQSGHECHTVSWHDLYKGGAERTVLLNGCRIEGQWELMS